MVYVNLNFLTRKLNFCNNAEKFPPTGWNFLSECPKITKTVRGQSVFPKSLLPWTHRMQLRKPCKIFTAKKWDFFAQYQQFIAEQWQKTNFIGLVFLKVRLQFWQPCLKISAKGHNCFSAMCEDSKGNQLKTVSPNSLFLWTRRMQLYKPCYNV